MAIDQCRSPFWGWFRLGVWALSGWLVVAVGSWSDASLWVVAIIGTPWLILALLLLYHAARKNQRRGSSTG